MAKKFRQRSTRRLPNGQRPQASAPASEAAAVGARFKIWILGGAVIAAVAVFALGMSWRLLIVASTPQNRAPEERAAAYVGSEACAGCHQAEARLWLSSHHKLAMDHATEKSVLGDFNDASFVYFGVHSRFFRRDGKFLVETDGPDGKLTTFEVRYTFGVEPLQQYLIEFPDGRLQALSIAWDSRPKDKGGQRWFHLYPNEEIRHDDVLHWTKLNQNWNFMCAECHSTGVRKNYDAADDRFATTWAEISVGCEACHGQGSAHVAWAHGSGGWWPGGNDKDPSKGLLVRFDERRDAVWPLDATTGNPHRSLAPPTLRKEVETCGLCHARRGEFSEDWIPGHWLSDTHVVAPLSRGVFHPDGQMRDQDEAYNYAPFKQSKMFAAGVTCSDCHDPHSANLRYSGDNVCLQCHSSAKYASLAHSRHEGVNPPLGCPSCHMPSRTYMVVDRRHDHSLRIPRPDLSAKLGVPNACNDCHTDKSAQWAVDAIDGWRGPEHKRGFQHYASAFQEAWTDQPSAESLLSAVAADPGTPGFARASALTELAPYLSPSTIALARSGLVDPDPMVRIGALDILENVPPLEIWSLVSPLLSDPIRGARIRAAELLAVVPRADQPVVDRDRFDSAVAEFVAAQRLNADRPEAHMTLGSFYARRGQTEDAESEYKAALTLAPQFSPAAVNLADLYRQLSRDGDGERELRAAIDKAPSDSGLHYALGLTLTRLKRPDEALREFGRAADLGPDQARYAYVYAIALHSADHRSESISALTDALTRHPGNRNILRALIAFSRDAGDLVSALKYAEQLTPITPDDRDLAELVKELKRRMGNPRAE